MRDLKTLLQTPGCHLNPEVSFPITLGTAPIGDQNDFYTNAPNGLSTTTSISNDFSNCMMAPSVTTMPPLPPTNFQHPNPVIPSTAAQINSEFVPTALSNFQYPNVPMPPTATGFSNTEITSTSTNFHYPPSVPNMMPPIVTPTAPFNPNGILCPSIPRVN